MQTEMWSTQLTVDNHIKWFNKQSFKTQSQMFLSNFHLQNIYMYFENIVIKDSVFIYSSFFMFQ